MSILLPLVLSFWPVWDWYFRRLLDGSDEPWGIFALIAATLLVAFERRRQVIIFSPAQLSAGGVGLVTYIALLDEVPPLFKALIAVLTIGALFVTSVRCDFALGSLLVLSLPLLSSLEFFCGYPLRLVLTQCVAALLTYVGQIPVTASGTLLLWGQKTVAIDSPCSGVHMLWVGLFLASALAAALQLSRRGTVTALLIALRYVLIGNILRTTLLFYKESGIVSLPAWTHEGIGTAVFGVVVVCITLRMKGLSDAK